MPITEANNWYLVGGKSGDIINDLGDTFDVSLAFVALGKDNTDPTRNVTNDSGTVDISANDAKLVATDPFGNGTDDFSLNDWGKITNLDGSLNENVGVWIYTGEEKKESNGLTITTTSINLPSTPFTAVVNNKLYLKFATTSVSEASPGVPSENLGSITLFTNLTSGEFYNETTFGGNTTPNPSLFGPFPNVEYDTYVTINDDYNIIPSLPNNSPADTVAWGNITTIAGASTPGLIWSTTGFAVTADIPLMIANLTLTTNANGTLHLYYSDANYASGEYYEANILTVTNGIITSSTTNVPAYPPFNGI